jgi:DNA adenine methylase
LYISFFSFAGLRKNFQPDGTKIRDRIHGRFEDIHNRLKGVTILNQDYKKVLKKYDGENVLFYLDPPYYKTDNKSYSNKNIDFEELLDTLKDLKGYFVLSINDDPYIRKLFKDFTRHRLPSVRYTVQNDTDTTVNELVFTNF